MPQVKKCADIYTKTKVKEILSEGVRVENEEGDFIIKADSIVCALGFRSKWTEVDALCEKAEDYYIVGDCKNVGQIYQAMNDGYYAAMSI